MAQTPRLTPSLRQTQRLALTPGLRQGMHLLHLPTDALIEDLAALSTENPLLELRRPAPPAPGPQIADTDTLADHVARQLALMPLDAEIAQLAEFLTGDLDDDGYLSSSTAELAELLALPPARIEAAVRALQACEPAGIGARCLAESLALQLIDHGIAPDEAQAAARHLDLLAEGRWTAAARATGLTRDRLGRIAALIPHLSPTPAARFGPTPPPLIPDFTVTKGPDGTLGVQFTEGSQPELVIDTALLASLSANAPDIVKTYRAPSQAAISALAFRQSTLLRVTRALVTHQHRFFLLGPDHMAPLSRAALAETLGLHASTVGRAIAGKALEFNGAVMPLSRLLTPALAGSDGQAISAFAVQQRIRRMVDAEPPAAPLSDDQIAAALRREGVDIARRTVAKYRGCMKIPSSFDRRRQKANKPFSPPAPTGMPNEPT